MSKRSARPETPHDEVAASAVAAVADAQPKRDKAESLEALLKSPLIVNGILAAVVAGALVTVPKALRPWWIHNAVIAAIAGGVGAGWGFFKWAPAAEPMKKALTPLFEHARTRPILVIVLVLELIAGVALFVTRPHLIRVIPSAGLDRKLGWPAQTLRIATHGREYLFDLPQKTSFYAGCGTDCVHYYFDNEPKDGRQAILDTVLKDHYEDPTDPKKLDPGEFSRSWFGTPVIMRKGDRVEAILAGSLTTGTTSEQLSFFRVDSGSWHGVETYVAKAQ